ncbi:MAG: hypothetical protein II034_09195 [Muribaculaceae bacterium]|nr:hypothetical protein [Muribaculaceae bacterium]
MERKAVQLLILLTRFGFMSPSTSSPQGGLFLLQAKPAKTTSKPVDAGDFQCGWGKKSQKGVILQYKKSQKGV